MSWDRYHITADFDVWAESEDQAQQFASLALEYYDRASGAIPVQGIGAPEGSPVTATPRPDGGYWIAAGHRRTRAAKAAGITTVPCIVQAMTERQLLDTLVVQGRDLGKVVHVKLKLKRKKQPAPRVDYEAERKRNEEKAKAETVIRAKILGEILAKIEWPFTRANLELIATAAIDREGPAMCAFRGIKANWENAADKLIATAPTDEGIARLIIEALLFGEAHPDGYDLRTEPSNLLTAAKRYKVDAAKIRKEAEEAENAAAGTRREVTPADAGEGAELSAAGKRRQVHAKKAAAKAAKKKPEAKKVLTPAERKRIVAATRKRWAEFRAKKGKLKLSEAQAKMRAKAAKGKKK